MTVETTRRREIEDAASELFRSNGYAATSVRDIARALDLQGASLYAHVASKEDVLWSIVDRAAGRFERAAEAAAANARATGSGQPDGAARRLEALIRAHVAVVLEDVGAAAVFVHEWRALGDERRAAVLARRDSYERRFRAVVADGMADGEFALGDPALAATVILTALNGLATWVRLDGRLAPDRLADHLVDLLLRALGAEPT